MGLLEANNAAWALDRKARAEGWPFRCDATLDFGRRELNALRDLWRARATGKAAPSRADFDARSLKPYLRHIMIIERVYVAPDRWRYRTRLAGTAVTEIIGDPTGKFLDQQLPPELLPRWTSVYDAVLDGAEPLRLVADFELPQLCFLRGEILIAPLADRNGRLTLVFGCIYFAPRRGKD
jgi:hypothetical protein